MLIEMIGIQVFNAVTERAHRIVHQNCDRSHGGFDPVKKGLWRPGIGKIEFEAIRAAPHILQFCQKQLRLIGIAAQSHLLIVRTVVGDENICAGTGEFTRDRRTYSRLATRSCNKRHFTWGEGHRTP